VLKISHCSVFVADQGKARRFYTDVLGFAVKHDLPVGDFNWLTVVSAAGPEGVELLLEPNDNPAAKAYQEAIYGQGIPATMFTVDDIGGEYDRLTGLGVVVQAPPTEVGGVVSAVFDDTCGNLISVVQAS
jgi:catechol 2,3-dioxygenase-like lactoylglutathione lyase family enzyme